MRPRPVALIVLDGWGLSDAVDGNAIAQAKTPNIDRLFATYPHARLAASGREVGVMDGQMGDSNIGHLNLGAGRIVYQDLVRINKAIEERDFFSNEAIQGAMRYARDKGTKLHLMGLVSPGGVHSHSDHLYALLQMAADYQVQNVYVHAFLDGRDVPPTSAKEYIQDLLDQAERIGVGQVASVCGRYYAMDRDNRWDRTEKAYRALVFGEGRQAGSALEAVETAYKGGETDEFVVPTVIVKNGKPVATIESDDAVIFFNFRYDRARQLTRAFTEEGFHEFPVADLPGLYFVCMTQYDEKIKVPVAFGPADLEDTLGEVLSKYGLRQLRIAETEKYAHVTFFFNGGRETPNPGEDRVLIPSPLVATYDLQPEMSAYKITERVKKEIASGKYDVIIMNYANLDMVGHTGDFQATVKAVEAVDDCVGQVVQAVLEAGGELLVTGDHGNAEKMVDPETGQPHTAHTPNKVPVIYVGGRKVSLSDGKLGDVAPTLLEILGLPKPPAMTGESLFKK
ncbi:MAG: 2,3-bisphosphoglycerate-independent phosphoglycerate mutase [Firmicutes bacterium]|nr:2,3-bisphosphoglycerate-independent phosphoglycerate mutase [Bacillota bacterium]